MKSSLSRQLRSREFACTRRIAHWSSLPRTAGLPPLDAICPIVILGRKKASQSFMAFLKQDTGECVTLRLDWQNAATILETVQTLVGLNPGKRIVVVWDNATWYQNQLIRDEFTNGNTLQDVHLINFPPYAPDRNLLNMFGTTPKT